MNISTSQLTEIISAVASQQALVNYVTVDKASELTGYTVDAINSNIDKGYWTQGEQYIIVKPKRRLISIKGFNQWVESQASTKALEQQANQALKSVSAIRACGARSASSSSPQPLT